MTGTPPVLSCLPVTGVGEIVSGDDLADVFAGAGALVDGDILVVTSKVVSKAEGRVVSGDRASALAGETDRLVARRGLTSIVRTHHGLVMAAAGVDASNTTAGTVVLLPVDPDASARGLRDQIAARTGANVAVVVTDTAGRAWREGQTDIAVGAAGLEVCHDFAGRTDDYGNELAVTAPAVADELAATADLVKGKLRRCPAAVVRGLSGLVLPAGEHGPGARALVREEAGDMFGYGAREAVHRAVAADPADLRGFGAPSSAQELVHALDRLTGRAAVVSAGTVEVRLPLLTERELGRLEARLGAVAFAMGWVDTSGTAPRHTVLRFRPGSP